MIDNIKKGGLNMKYSNIVIGGGGVLGSQIAFQAAFCGFHATIWLRSEGSISRTQPKIDKLKETYLEAIEKMATGEGPWCAAIRRRDPALRRPRDPPAAALPHHRFVRSGLQRVRLRRHRFQGLVS